MITVFDIPIKCKVKKDDNEVEGYLVCVDENGFMVIDDDGEKIGVFKKEEIDTRI